MRRKFKLFNMYRTVALRSSIRRFQAERYRHAATCSYESFYATYCPIIILLLLFFMDNKPTRLHNSQLTVKALRPLVLGQRWFSLGYLSLKDKTKHKGFFSEQPREYTNEKSEWRFIYFQPKVESMMVYFSHFIPGEAGKK